MVIEIDQSGKLEDTSVDTIISAANASFQRSIKIPAREKRKTQQFFRHIGKPRMYTYHVFAILIFILLRKHIRTIDRIIIDCEYPGKENVIRIFLTQKLQTIYPLFEPDIVVFQAIGKSSPAHVAAYGTFKKRLEPNISATAQDILKIIAA